MVVDSFVVAVVVVGVGAGSADGGIRVDNVGGVERVAVAVAVGVVGVDGAGDDEAGVVVVVVVVIAVAAEVAVGGEGGVDGVGGVVEVAAAAVIVVVAMRCWGGTSEDEDGRGVGKVGMGRRVEERAALYWYISSRQDGREENWWLLNTVPRQGG